MPRGSYNTADDGEGHGSDSKTRPEAQHSGGDTAWSGWSRLTPVCELCVLLLTAITVLWINYNILKTENNHLQTSNNTLTIAREQLQTINTNLTIAREQLQTINTDLTIAREQLQTINTNLTIAREQLQTINTNLTIAREQLQTINNNLTIAREQLQTINNNLTIEREQLQREREQFQREKDELQRFLKLGWIYSNSSVYINTTESKNWTESRQNCRERGADLVIITSTEEQEFVNKLRDGRQAWIGLSDRDRENKWKWVDDTPLITGFWASGEPNSKAGDKDCVIAGETSDPVNNWADYPCNKQFHWICEKRIFN